MTVISIRHPECFRIVDQQNNIFYGCNQEWYMSEWQRRSGCGPSVASHLVHYLTNCHAEGPRKDGFVSKHEYLRLMEEVWQFVTPGKRGMPETGIFYTSLSSYAKSKRLAIEYKFLDMPNKTQDRPTLSSVISFIETALRADAPVAFLNLCSGKEKNLDRWHWVTIISMKREEDNTVRLTLLDEGIEKTANLSLWYDTTELGGGFVYFTKKHSERS